jgi:hypothetical protein
MQVDGNTEENNDMKVSLITLFFGFFLVAGLPLAATAGPTPGGLDGDGDTVEDGFDNCSDDANAGQEDDDHDGCGDVCDPVLQCDANNDGIVDGNDFITMSQTWKDTAPLPLAADCNTDNVVDGNDFIILSQTWKARKGPSGISNPSRDLTECPPQPGD